MVHNPRRREGAGAAKFPRNVGTGQGRAAQHCAGKETGGGEDGTADEARGSGDDVQVMRRSEEEKAHPHAGRSNTKSNDGDGKGRLSRGEDWLGDIHEDTPQRN